MATMKTAPPTRTTMCEISMTQLIDALFVLLIIFLVTIPIIQHRYVAIFGRLLALTSAASFRFRLSRFTHRIIRSTSASSLL